MLYKAKQNVVTYYISVVFFLCDFFKEELFFL